MVNVAIVLGITQFFAFFAIQNISIRQINR